MFAGIPKEKIGLQFCCLRIVCRPDHHRLAGVAGDAGEGRSMVVERIEGRRERGFSAAISHLRKIMCQFPGHRDLLFRRLGEGHPDGVAQAVGQQCADARGRADAPFAAFSRFGDAQVEGVEIPFGSHRSRQQAVGLHHHTGVARLHREHHLVETLLTADTQVLHGRNDHAAGRITVFFHDARGQRAVVDAYAQGCPVLSQQLQQRYQPLPDLLQRRLLPAFRGKILRYPHPHEVARVDAHLLHDAGRRTRDVGIEMDIGDQGGTVTPPPQAVAYVGQVLRLGNILRCETYIICAGTDDAYTLLHTRFRIGGGRGGHALQTDGMIPAQRHIPHMHLACPDTAGRRYAFQKYFL